MKMMHCMRESSCVRLRKEVSTQDPDIEADSATDAVSSLADDEP